MLLADKQTNQRYRKHNILGGGKNHYINEGCAILCVDDSGACLCACILCVVQSAELMRISGLDYAHILLHLI